MSSIQHKIEELKQNGFQLEFGETFEDAFSIWQKIFGYGALALLIVVAFQGIISMAFNLLSFVSDAQSEMEEQIIQNPGDMEVIKEVYINYFSDPQIIGMQILSQLLMALIFPIIAGIVYLAYKYDTEGKTDFSYLFEGFNGSNFGKLIGLFFLYKIASFVGVLFFGIGFFIPFVGFSMASCFILINKMGVMESIKASFALAFKNFFTVLFLLIVGILFGALGVFACGIGVFLTMPMVTILCYSIYKKSVGVEAVNEMLDIGKPLN